MKLKEKEINSVAYEELTKYLKEKNEHIEKDLFRAILAALRWVQSGSTVKEACGMSGMSVSHVHYEAKVLTSYVSEVTKRLNARLEDYQRKIEEIEENKKVLAETISELRKQLEDSSEKEEVTVKRSSLAILLDEFR